MKIYDQHGNPSRAGAGIFPRAVIERFPLLPLEDVGWIDAFDQLHDKRRVEALMESSNHNGDVGSPRGLVPGDKQHEKQMEG